jgi:hypothetical protein
MIVMKCGQVQLRRFIRLRTSVTDSPFHFVTFFEQTSVLIVLGAWHAKCCRCLQLLTSRWSVGVFVSSAEIL